MALIECADCHKSVSVAATQCPNCGRPTALPADDELSEIAAKARPAAKRAGVMALLWCGVATGALMFAQYQESLAISLIWLWAMIAATYQFYQRFKYRNLIRGVESVGAQRKDVPHPS